MLSVVCICASNPCHVYFVCAHSSLSRIWSQSKSNKICWFKGLTNIMYWCASACAIHSFFLLFWKTGINSWNIFDLRKEKNSNTKLSIGKYMRTNLFLWRNTVRNVLVIQIPITQGMVGPRTSLFHSLILRKQKAIVWSSSATYTKNTLIQFIFRFGRKANIKINISGLMSSCTQIFVDTISGWYLCMSMSHMKRVFIFLLIAFIPKRWNFKQTGVVTKESKQESGKRQEICALEPNSPICCS